MALSLTALLGVVVLMCVLIVVLEGRCGGGDDDVVANWYVGRDMALTLPRDRQDDVTEPCASFSMHLIPERIGNETSWEVLRYDRVKMSRRREAMDAGPGALISVGVRTPTGGYLMATSTVAAAATR